MKKMNWVYLAFILVGVFMVVQIFFLYQRLDEERKHSVVISGWCRKEIQILQGENKQLLKEKENQTYLKMPNL